MEYLKNVSYYSSQVHRRLALRAEVHNPVGEVPDPDADEPGPSSVQHA